MHEAPPTRTQVFKVFWHEAVVACKVLMVPNPEFGAEADAEGARQHWASMLSSRALDKLEAEASLLASLRQAGEESVGWCACRS